MKVYLFKTTEFTSTGSTIAIIWKTQEEAETHARTRINKATVELITA